MTTLARCCACSFIIFTYWSGIVSAQLVDIPDPNLREAVRETLALPDEIPLTQQEMLRLTRLAASKRQIKDLTGLEHATNLTGLSLHQNSINNLKSLAELTHLKSLSLWGNPISDLSPLANLTELTGLDLGACQISDIIPLANLTQLRWLHLHYNQISEITSLTKLTQLTDLWLQSNQISDITPIAGLKQLVELALSHNRIVDVSPLAGLENLMDLKLVGNPIRDFSPLLGLDPKHVDIDIHMLQELASVEVEMPDPNLEHAIREKLGLSDEIPLTQADMLQLGGLDAKGRQITDLTGLEHATNLTWLDLGDNDIRDLQPIAELTQLDALYIWGNPISDISPLKHLISLRRLVLVSCEISDITPLTTLTQLEVLSLNWNRLIVDISPLRNLTRLTQLWLSYNRIVDVSPLANLTMLEELYIHNNAITDFSPLDGLSLIRFEYDEICELPRIPIRERLQNRKFPSFFQAWHGIINRPTLSYEARVAQHDLHWSPGFGLHWLETDQGIQLAGYLNRALQQRDALLALNPNMIFIRGIPMRDAGQERFPEEWPYWLRDAAGNRVPDERWKSFLIDFTLPDAQEWIIQHALAVSKCGLYDGIFIDWWSENYPSLVNPQTGEIYRTLEVELRARKSILQRIRDGVGNDFLIMVNPNRRKTPHAAPYINGFFMETLRDYEGGYTHEGLMQIESTVLWAEKHLQEPQIICLEGWGVPAQSPDSTTNRRWMRVFTTMSLTHSDGYVVYNTGVGTPGHDHDHYWYDFWEANLGRPVGPKAQRYQNIEALFIREFTNGWAVYNRSGVAREVSLTQDATGVASGQTGRKHQLADLDGEIYLRAGTRPAPTDINGDGVVNILDLILVAQNFGTTKSDINGDGTTNILDLILVAQHLGETSTAAAPAALPASLSPETVQEWIDMAHAQNDGSVAFAQGIATLERLLALMIPNKTVLRANYPNPFNPETWIPYHLASDTEVRINIYDIQGVLARQFNIGHQKAGYYTDRTKATYWDGRNKTGEPVSSGIYFYTLTTDGYTGIRRMAIVK